MKLYMVRHGQTDWNKERRLQGRTDIPLNEFGRHLAEETGKGLADISFEICFTSPLVRARETAELILAGREVPIIPDERITELSFGELEGRCCSEEGWDLPDEFEKFFTDTAHYEAPEGGEDFSSIRERTGDFLRELCAREELKDKTVLITTHGAALCGLLNNVKGKTIAEYWGVGVHKNCGVTIVEVKDGKASVLEENKVYYKDRVKDW